MLFILMASVELVFSSYLSLYCCIISVFKKVIIFFFLRKPLVGGKPLCKYFDVSLGFVNSLSEDKCMLLVLFPSMFK